MDVGDEVPSEIEQMRADFTLLQTDDPITGSLSAYGAIVVGTRAYAVRRDLISYNEDLLEYVRQRANLIVLYQTQELIPKKLAPSQPIFRGEPTKFWKRTLWCKS